MRPGSCARVTGTRTNDTAAALPMRAMNSRRLMASSPCRTAPNILNYTIFLNEPGGVRHSRFGVLRTGRSVQMITQREPIDRQRRIVLGAALSGVAAMEFMLTRTVLAQAGQ